MHLDGGVADVGKEFSCKVSRKILSNDDRQDYASHRRLITLTICVCQFHELNDTEITDYLLRRGEQPRREMNTE